MSAGVRRPGWPAEWAAWRAILIQAVRERRAHGRLWANWMLIALILGFAVFAAARPSKWVFVLGVGQQLGVLCGMWWVLYFQSMQGQLSPIAVQLTPHLRERARRLTVALWAAMVLTMTLVVGLPIGYPAHVGVATGLLLLEVSVFFGVYRWFSLVAAFLLLLNAGPSVASWNRAFVSSNAAVAVGLVVLFFNGRIALRRMFPTTRRLSPSPVPPSGVPLAITRLARVLQAVAGNTTSGQPLITRVLGPSAFGGLRLVPVVVAAVCLAMHAWAPHEGLVISRWLLLISLLMMQGAMAINERTSAYARRSEQALVRLAPGAPCANELNRYLARYRLHGFARMWLSMTALAVVALLLLGASAGEAARAAVVCSFVLIFAGLPLHDYSRREPMAGRSSVFLSLLVVAAGGGAFFALRGDGGTGTWLACALAAIMVAAMSVAHRWASIAKAPPAYPAGRNG